MKKLLDILSYSRYHGSVGEKIIIDKYIMPLNPSVFKNKEGEDMAYVIEIGEDSTILWSCHTDTVHSEKDNVICPVVMKNNIIYSSENNILGADDGAGMWLMLEMIENGVEGTYIFHRGEECGGIGSHFMASYHYDWLSRFTHAIAFDRKGENSIITHQFGRCCSDKFAKEFAETIKNLSNNTINLVVDNSGIFTDTANYTGIIPECTNISVGYYGAHTNNEHLNFKFLNDLKNALIKINKHSYNTYEQEDGYWKNSYNSYNSYDSFSIESEEFYNSFFLLFYGMDYEDALYYIKNNPEEIAYLINKHIL